MYTQISGAIETDDIGEVSGVFHPACPFQLFLILPSHYAALSAHCMYPALPFSFAYLHDMLYLKDMSIKGQINEQLEFD